MLARTCLLWMHTPTVWSRCPVAMAVICSDVTVVPTKYVIPTSTFREVNEKRRTGVGLPVWTEEDKEKREPIEFCKRALQEGRRPKIDMHDEFVEHRNRGSCRTVIFTNQSRHLENQISSRRTRHDRNPYPEARCPFSESVLLVQIRILARHRNK